MIIFILDITLFYFSQTHPISCEILKFSLINNNPMQILFSQIFYQLICKIYSTYPSLKHMKKLTFSYFCSTLIQPFLKELSWIQQANY